MNKIISWLAIGIGIIALIVAVVGGNNQPRETPINFGASGTRFPNGISADSTSPAVGEVRGADLTATDDLTVTDDVTVNGGVLTVTTTNTATSTMIAGCWQFYATSTATALKYVATTTPGLMHSQYGTCP